MIGAETVHPAEKLLDADWSVRKRAVLALGKLDDPAVVPALIRSLQDNFMSVRAVAAIELGKRSDVSAVPGLIAALQDEEWIVRKNVVIALGKLGEPSAAPALIERLQDLYDGIRTLVALDLGKMGELAAIPRLVEMLGYQDADVQANASSVLTGMGVPAVGALLQYLSHLPVQRKIGWVLWNMGDATVLPRKIVAEQRLSARDRITVLEKLRRARNPWGSSFLYKFPEIRDLCLAVLQEEDAEARAGAQTVLNWLNGDRHLVHASQSAQENDGQELLRVSESNDVEHRPETLLRSSDTPDANNESLSPRRSPWERLFGKRKDRGHD